ncbi:TPA: type I toxin-antitoxin system Fst family toxin [Staphylococcus aureus]|nr:type I toxin-antitoxin system Fst family toxin [Staphylococcus aureus]HDP5921244.1 type I toxin-antitoxin system Fst family toxin [Staphylococcus aureus]HDP6018786.1 type I toxin-antitoxin system Fst family toxin [Staphylococcus aureus]
MTAIFVYIIVSIFIECCVALFKFWLEQRSKK